MVEVLAFSHYYFPGYKAGGTLRTIVNMVEQTGDDVMFKIITSDRDLGHVEQYDNVKINQWSKVGNALIYYQAHGASFFDIIKLLRSTSYDVIYLNSFFDYSYSIRILLLKFFISPRKHIILAPRGEFSGGALNIKRTKKNIYLKLVRILGIYNNITWQASSEYEKNDILNAGVSAGKNILVVPDLSSGNSLYKCYEKQKRSKIENELKICFISRISKKKNLDFALHILSRVKYQVQFDIYGPKEDSDYWRECESIISNAPSNVNINYLGMIEYDNVVDTFGKYDMFFFPTHGENYGHVIVESMLAGTPVLISDNTPWLDLLEHNVGWVHSLDKPDDFLDSIELAINMKPDDYSVLRCRVHKYIEKKLNNPAVKKANVDMFAKLKK